MGSRSSKKHQNDPNYISSKNKPKELTKEQKRTLWWMTNKKKVIIISMVVLAILGISIIAGVTSNGGNKTSVGGQYTLIDLGSKGCIPCDNLQPVLDSLRNKYRGKINVNFYDVNNTSQGAELGRKYNVTSIPTLIFLDKDGKVVKRSVGYKSQSQLESDFRSLGWI